MTESGRLRELVIVGGGPAGLAAAAEARRAGVDVLLLEERRHLGGQIYRPQSRGVGIPPHQAEGDRREGAELVKTALGSGAEIRTAVTVWGAWDRQLGLVSDEGQASLVRWEHLILATGAYDRPVVFPGWTLPGVMTAGAAQVLAKSHLVKPGRRVLLAGSGPLLLAVAAQLAARGVGIVGVFEAAARPSVLQYLELMRRSRGSGGILGQAMGYWWSILRSGTGVHYGRIIVRAEGEGRVEQAVVTKVDEGWRPVAGTERVLNVDAVCMGYGLVASSELSRLIGCEHRFDELHGGHLPVRDAWMRTTVPGVLSAGDGSGIAGVRVAIEEGRLAGLGAAIGLGCLTEAQADRKAVSIRRRLARFRRFASAIDLLYPQGHGIYELADRETTVCRCEEVTAGAIADAIRSGAMAPKSIKALTRAGMGPCQGRYCSRHIAAMVSQIGGWPGEDAPPFPIRTPIKPVLISAIAEERPDPPLGAGGITFEDLDMS